MDNKILYQLITIYDPFDTQMCNHFILNITVKSHSHYRHVWQRSVMKLLYTQFIIQRTCCSFTIYTKKHSLEFDFNSEVHPTSSPQHKQICLCDLWLIKSMLHVPSRDSKRSSASPYTIHASMKHKTL